MFTTPGRLLHSELKNTATATLCAQMCLCVCVCGKRTEEKSMHCVFVQEIILEGLLVNFMSDSEIPDKLKIWGECVCVNRAAQWPEMLFCLCTRHCCRTFSCLRKWCVCVCVTECVHGTKCGCTSAVCLLSCFCHVSLLIGPDAAARTEHGAALPLLIYRSDDKSTHSRWVSFQNSIFLYYKEESQRDWD